MQIFGGRAITQTGMGRFVEHYHRTIAFDALLGGGVYAYPHIYFRVCNHFTAEDVLADLGVRQALRFMPKDIRL